MRIEEGWLKKARRVVSPNQDARPAGEVSAVVLHSISLPPGEFGGEHIERLFTNRLGAAAHPYFGGIAQLRVSAHLLIRRDGECVQFVPFDRRVASYPTYTSKSLIFSVSGIRAVGRLQAGNKMVSPWQIFWLCFLADENKALPSKQIQITKESSRL